eukprot:216159-Chlamydomonas_euryale.AAC.1
MGEFGWSRTSLARSADTPIKAGRSESGLKAVFANVVRFQTIEAAFGCLRRSLRAVFARSQTAVTLPASGRAIVDLRPK